MSEYIYLLILIPIFLLAFLVGCSPVIPDPPVEPVTDIHIKPDSADVYLGESIELACLDQLDRPAIAEWSKRCGAGSLSVAIGEVCIYTVPNSMTGIQEVYADYEDLRAIANIKGIGR